MRIFQINGGVFGSTGKIMFGLAQTAREQNCQVACASPITSTNRYRQPSQEYLRIGTYYGRCFSVLLARLTGLEGQFAFGPTRKLIRKIKAFQPDVIHIHSIHNSYLNIPMLFHYLKSSGIPVVWTLHDCWAFTGHCPYFDMVSCEKWKNGCEKCPQYREYPASCFDNAEKMYRKKKLWFTGLSNLTIVTPSAWLADLAKQSFLNQYPIRVIHNGIDLSVFCPQESHVRQKYNITKEYLLLGVAFDWGERKGLDVFEKLAEKLDDRYQILLVGTDDNIDRRLTDRIISVHRTQDQQELAELYSAADLFVNPTREENYPTVNMEAIACGTPVLTFDTGGSPEILDEKTGAKVPKDDLDGLVRQIRKLCANPKDPKVFASRAKTFDQNNRFGEYIQLYEELSHDTAARNGIVPIDPIC